MTDDDLDCCCDFPDTCGGSGMLYCLGCGGDLCICLCGGNLECYGCGRCDDGDDADDDGVPGEEAMKRLTPDEMQAHYRTREPLDRIGLDLREDHFQAREDLKWLAGQLRRLMCSDPTCTACVEDRARLAEVES